MTTTVVQNHRGYKYIVIHHTATEKHMTAEEMELSMRRTWIENRWSSHVPAHYIVWSDGWFKKVNDLDKVVWATQNADANLNGIHIEIVWDFNKTEPTEEQYSMVWQLIEWIKEKYPDMEVKFHRDFQPHSCPWRNFDIDKVVKKKQNKLEVKEWWYLGQFSLSRYYSVMEWQSRYYNGKTYEEDFKMNCHWDCLRTANWTQLTDELMYKTVACPPEIWLWTELYVEWVGIVKCNDRWSAIKNKRLDMWCGIGDDALNNWSKCPTGKRNVYLVWA